MALEEEIRLFIAENFIVSESLLSNEDSLTQTGIIDSLGVLELVAFLEKRFSVHVTEAETLPENLDSVNNIVRYIEGKLARPLELHDNQTATV
jgi:acyl carrier protein